MIGRQLKFPHNKKVQQSRNTAKMSVQVPDIQIEAAPVQGEWIREATDLEKEMEEGHQVGHLLAWYQADLSSEETLREDQVRKALTHLYRKTPNLGACYGMREGTMWLRRVTNPEVDFQVLKGLGIEEMRDILRNYRYYSDTGPLFCARLLQESPDHAEIEDLDPLHPHKSYLFFGTHQGLTDGNCTMYLMGFFLTLLNDVIKNKPVDDAESLGTFIADEFIKTLVMEKKSLLEEDSLLQKRLADDFEYLELTTPLIIKGFPTPQNEEARTASVVKTFDQGTTTKFLQKCKTERVTLNSALTSLTNVAIIDTLVEHNFIQSSYVIQNFHMMNLRRYMNLRVPDSLGIHITGSPLKMCTDTPKNLEGSFWEYAKTFSETIKQEIDSGRVFCDQAYKLLTSGNRPTNEEITPPGIVYTGDFVTSNLGDVTAAVTIGDKVRISNIIGGATFHKTEYPVVMHCNTFRERLNIVYDYVASFVDASVMERICFNIAARLFEMIE